MPTTSSINPAKVAKSLDNKKEKNMSEGLTVALAAKRAIANTSTIGRPGLFKTKNMI